jgi:hypothetical protein
MMVLSVVPGARTIFAERTGRVNPWRGGFYKEEEGGTMV